MSCKPFSFHHPELQFNHILYMYTGNQEQIYVVLKLQLPSLNKVQPKYRSEVYHMVLQLPLLLYLEETVRQHLPFLTLLWQHWFLCNCAPKLHLHSALRFDV